MVVGEIKHPGSYDDLHNEVKQCQAKPIFFHEAKVGMGKVVTDFPQGGLLQTSHKLDFGEASYTFNTTLLLGDMAEPKTIGVCEVSTGGTFFGKIIHNFNKKVKGVFTHQNAPEMGMDYTQFEVEYSGKDFSSNFKLAEPNFLGGRYAGSINYLQSLSKYLSFGAELSYQQHDLREGCDLQLSGRYHGTRNIFTGGLKPHTLGLKMSYLHRVSDKVALYTDYDADLLGNESTCNVGYHFDLTHCSLRGQVSTNCDIAAVMENKLGPGVSLTLTGLINHLTGVSKFGFGFSVGGQ